MKVKHGPSHQLALVFPDEKFRNISSDLQLFSSAVLNLCLKSSSRSLCSTDGCACRVSR